MLGKAQEALKQSEKLAIAGLHAGVVMHEVDNPLEAIGNLLYLAKLERNNPAKMSHYIQQAEEHLGGIQQISRRSLSFYRRQVEPQRLYLTEVIEAALAVHRPVIEGKKLRLKKEWLHEISVLGYAGELLQASSNLILNAVQALHAGGTLQVRIRQRNGFVRLAIADNGPGISPELKGRLFKPLQTTTKAHGNGLGLWVSKDIIERHGGRIRCRSSIREGRSGTTFAITLFS